MHSTPCRGTSLLSPSLLFAKRFITKTSLKDGTLQGSFLIPPDGAGAGNVMDVGTRPRIGSTAAQESFIRACGSHPAMLFHCISFLLANGTGLLHGKDVGTDVGEEMKEEIPTGGITLVLFPGSIPINEMVEALWRRALA